MNNKMIDGVRAALDEMAVAKSMIQHELEAAQEEARNAAAAGHAEGYYKDKEKSDATFKEFKGTRYSFPGDYALVEEDGTITLLGRGSNCINSAGEKIYPEEVEEALKLNENIYDSLVVGLPDERFGNKVVAVVSLNETGDIDEANLISATREHLSGYKLPKSIIFVPEVMRAPNGKADYKWAKKTAEIELA